MSIQDGPIVIGGLGRSGTSLFQAILGSHSQVSLLQSDPILWPLYNDDECDFRGASLSSQAQTCLLDKLFAQWKIQQLERPIRQADIEQALDDLERVSFADVLRVFLEHNAQHYGKPRWGYKGPLAEFVADAIFSSWPTTCMIHLVRDPRDVLASGRSRDWWPNTVLFMREQWNPSARQALQNRAKYPDRYMIVRFEDLVQAPEQTIRNVCDFAGLEFEPDMLEARDQPGWKGHNSHFRANAPDRNISAKPIRRYLEQLSPLDISICDELGGDLMLAHGYLPEPPSAAIRRAGVWGQILAQQTYWFSRRKARSISIDAGLYDTIQQWRGKGTEYP